MTLRIFLLETYSAFYRKKKKKLPLSPHPLNLRPPPFKSNKIPAKSKSV